MWSQWISQDKWWVFSMKYNGILPTLQIDNRRHNKYTRHLTWQNKIITNIKIRCYTGCLDNAAKIILVCRDLWLNIQNKIKENVFLRKSKRKRKGINKMKCLDGENFRNDIIWFSLIIQIQFWYCFWWNFVQIFKISKTVVEKPGWNRWWALVDSLKFFVKFYFFLSYI